MFKAKIKTLNGEKTKSGFVAITEYGGAYSNAGRVRLIAKQDGTPATATFLYQKGATACKSQALVPVMVGYKILIGERVKDDIRFRLYNVEAVNISNDPPLIILREINRYLHGRWFKDLFKKYEPMVLAAGKKLYDYHCRRPYFVEVKPHFKPEEPPAQPSESEQPTSITDAVSDVDA